MIVLDASLDPRFAETDLIVGAGIRCYVGAPLITRDGIALGSLSLLDVAPKHDFSAAQQSLLVQMAAMVVDLFERRHASRTADTLVAFADVAHQALIATDGEGRITYWNHGARTMFGYAPHEVEGQCVELIVPERFRAAHRDGLRRIAGGAASQMSGRPVEVLAVRRDGSEFPAELSLSVWNGPLGLGFGAKLQDISERRAQEERLHHLANHDDLTGLLNRNSFKARIEAQIDDAGTATVMVFDLDGFKDVNEGLDFGTGFASLSTLKNFPLSRLKLDRNFVEDLGIDPHSEAIVKGVVAIGHSLGLDVIAEGIETPEQEAMLRGWACDAGQGYHYGKAVTAAEFIATFGTAFVIASAPPLANIG